MSRNFDDASSQYLRHGAAVLTGMPVTMACWFFSDDATVNQTLIGFGHDSSGNHVHSIQAAGNVASDPVRASSQAGAGAAVAATSTGYTINTWHHAAGVFASATDRRAYIDGGSEGTNATGRSPTLNRTAIGALFNGGVASGFMSGFIAEAAIYNVALAVADIAKLAQGFSPLLVRPDALVAYWPLIGRHDPEIDPRGRFELSLLGSPAPSSNVHPRIIYPSSGRRFVVVPALTEIQGTLSQTLANATLSATGMLEIGGVTAITLENAGPAATGQLDIAGTLSQTLANATLAATATLTIDGASAVTLANATLSAQGALAIDGAVSQTLANATSDADGALDITGSLTATLEGATLDAQGTVGSDPIEGTLSQTLAAASLSATGALTIDGQLAQTLANATLSAAGELTIDGALTLTLADATVDATGAEAEEPTIGALLGQSTGSRFIGGAGHYTTRITGSEAA